MRAACSLAASCASTTLFANRTRAPSRWASSPAFASNAARSRISFPNTPSCVLCFFCLVMVFSFLSLWLGYGPYAFMAPDQNLLGFPPIPAGLAGPVPEVPVPVGFSSQRGLWWHEEHHLSTRNFRLHDLGAKRDTGHPRRCQGSTGKDRPSRGLRLAERGYALLSGEGARGVRLRRADPSPPRQRHRRGPCAEERDVLGRFSEPGESLRQ